MEVVSLRDFEEKIIDDFKTFDPMIGGGKSRPRKGIWLKAHLLDVGEDFIYAMWHRWADFIRVAHEREAHIELGTYAALRTYVFLLKRYGLIIPTKRERAKSTSREFFRQYYRLNLRRLEDPRWLNPYKPYASWMKWKLKGFPRPKKKPRPPRLPPGVPPTLWLSLEELGRIWAEAERFLTEHRYTITREDVEQIIPDWGVEAAGYKTFKERVGYVIHEAVEIEEVSLVARRLIDPRLAPEPVALKAHEMAEKRQKEYLRRKSS